MLCHYFFESVYNPYPKNKIPMTIAIMASIDRNGPTYSNPFFKQRSIFCSNITHEHSKNDMYFAETRITDIRQKNNTNTFIIHIRSSLSLTT